MTQLERCELAKERGITYNRITGELISAKGKPIKVKNHEGYIYLVVCKGGKYHHILGHRLCWYLHYGKLPKNLIDHIDGDKTNNRIENLRDVTNQQNHFNRAKTKGYTWYKSKNKFQAQIKLNGKNKNLGYFEKEEDARNAYLLAKEKYHIIPQ